MFLQRSSRYKKQYRELSEKIQIKINERLAIFLVDEFSPILNNHNLHGEYENCRSINVTGDFRLIYMKMSGDVRYLLEVGTHNQLYE